MFNKIFRPTAKNIKVCKIVQFSCAIFMFIFAFILFGQAGKYANSSYYYWSSNVRNYVSLVRGLGVFMLIVGLIDLGMGIGVWNLEKNGKVCSQCDRVYLPTVTACPICNIDLTHAMDVKKHLSIKPTVTKKPTITANPPAANSGTPNTGEKKRFCAFCGQELPGESAFCPKCGSKIQ